MSGSSVPTVTISSTNPFVGLNLAFFVIAVTMAGIILPGICLILFLLKVRPQEHPMNFHPIPPPRQR